MTTKLPEVGKRYRNKQTREIVEVKGATSTGCQMNGKN